VFAQVAEAIRRGRRIKLNYRSMRDPHPHERVISPHSLVRAGRRWHVRAFCSTNQQFRDYTLGRIEKPEILNEPSERESTEDTTWNTLLQVRLIAHPALSMPQRELVQFEYFAATVARADSCRAALVSYYIQDVRAATDIARQRPPEYQLAVENMEELSPWLFPG
jgi:predicted DNA-binding transcriptional regulator YafY